MDRNFFYFLTISLILFRFDLNVGLDNGLARTPPMGWLSWVAFWCETDCEKHPMTCVSEQQMTAMADRIVQDGYREAGYEYVIVDDCWLANTRDAQGKLQPDQKRFSHGIKWLADYMHNHSLKFGIYEDTGTKTCGGFPGSLGHEDTDAKTFASWGVDYVKLDGCYASITDINQGYPRFGKALNNSGRQMVYSCEWPLYTQMYEHKLPDYPLIREHCNLWRNWNDIAPNWDSLLSVIDYIHSHQEELIKVAGPGGWNDPDMLIIGKAGVTVDHAKVQMAIWSIWSAPLLISTDLRFMGEEYKKILQNRGVIAVNQDPLGIMGRLVVKTASVHIYVKPMTPKEESTGDHSYAIAFLNRDCCKQASVTVRRLEQLGLLHQKGYVLEDLFENKVIVSLGPKDNFSTVINPTGVAMYKATLVP